MGHWIAGLAAALACSADEPGGARFTALGEGAVGDAEAKLVWTARDSGRDLSWHDADQYCRELRLGAGTDGWRLPSSDELASLYEEPMQQPCGERSVCRVDDAIDLSSPYQWSGTAPRPDRRVYFDFSLGTQLSPLIRPTLTRRALCVRYGGE
jgi:hypothetical protein